MSGTVKRRLRLPPVRLTIPAASSDERALRAARLVTPSLSDAVAASSTGIDGRASSSAAAALSLRKRPASRHLAVIASALRAAEAAWR